MESLQVLLLILTKYVPKLLNHEISEPTYRISLLDIFNRGRILKDDKRLLDLRLSIISLIIQAFFYSEFEFLNFVLIFFF